MRLAAAETFEANEIVGMMIYIITAVSDTEENGVWSMITAYSDGDTTATVQTFAATPPVGTEKYRIFDCGPKATVSAKAACEANVLPAAFTLAASPLLQGAPLDRSEEHTSELQSP